MSIRGIANWVFAFLVLVAGLALWRSEVLNTPPYWTSAMGVFVQASSWANGDIESSATPAPSAYRNSFVPVIVAAVLKVLPVGEPVLVATRIIQFGFAVVALLAVFAWLRPQVGWAGGAIAAAAVATTPVFTVQSEQVTLEMPMIALVMLASVLLTRDSYVGSAIAGVGAFFAKWTGGIFLIAAPVYLIIRAVQEPDRWPTAIRGILVHLVAVAFAALVMWIRTDPGFYFGGWVPTWSFGNSPALDVWKWTPDLLILLALTIILAVAVARPVPTDPAAERPAVTLVDPPIALGGAFVVGMGALVNVAGAVPADMAVFAPFIVAAFAWAVLSHPSGRLFGMFAMYALVAVNLVNSTGMLLPSLPATQAIDWRTGSIRERSREYLADDHALNLLAIKSILRDCPEDRIIAPPPFVQFLSLPALGYVREPLRGYSLGSLSTSAFPSIEEIRTEELADMSVVLLVNRYAVGHEWSVPRRERTDTVRFPVSEEIRESEGFKRSPVAVYTPRRVPSEAMEVTRQRYVARFWPSTQLLPRAKQLIELNRPKDAEIILRQILEGNPKDSAARFQLAFLLEQLGRTEAALEEYDKVVFGTEEYWQALSRVAMIQTQIKDYVQADKGHRAALQAFERQEAQDPRNKAMLYLKWASNDLDQQYFSSAKEKLQKAIAIDPGLAVAYRELGFILFGEKQLDEARRQLELAIDLDRQDFLSHRYLAGVFYEQENWEYAQAEFAQALALNPDDNQSRDGSADCLIRLGRFEDAIYEYRDGIQRRPSLEREAELLLGVARAEQAQGNWGEVVNTLRLAHRTDPESKVVANQLAWTLATAPSDEFRNAYESLQLANTINTGDGEVPSQFLDTLAAAQAESGQWEEAAKTAERAIERANKEGRSDLATEYTTRRDLYQSNRAYRQAEN